MSSQISAATQVTARLTADMKRVVAEQRLAFVATVCADGTPNVSPKGTIAVWDDNHLVFADIRSPGTIANIRKNAAIEINVVDPFVRKGYRFKGTGQVITEGALFQGSCSFIETAGSTPPKVNLSCKFEDSYL
jgi:predicted pyridoxine 5'-phosphate oxidase superfamily flavin-nucleotide-binding protein